MKMQDIIKSRRTELQLTLEEVGNIVGVSKATVQRWENGKSLRGLKLPVIAELANIFEVSPTEFFNPEVIPKIAEEKEKALHCNNEELNKMLENPILKDICSLLAGFSPDQLEDAYNFALFLRQKQEEKGAE